MYNRFIPFNSSSDSSELCGNLKVKIDEPRIGDLLCPSATIVCNFGENSEVNWHGAEKTNTLQQTIKNGGHHPT